MRFTIVTKLLCSFLVVNILTSCLEGDDMNMPPDGSAPFIQMSYNANGGTLVNSGLRYFGNATLLMSPADEVDTVTFAATLQGVTKLNKDVAVNLTTPADAIDDNFENDGIVYQIMTDDQYDFINTSGVIPSGQNYAEFKVKFYPPNIDFTKNYILPVAATNDAGLTTSSNHGIVYFHIIGNDLAGVYKVVGKRYNYTKTVSWDGTIGTYPTPVGTVTSPTTKIAVPNSETEIALDYANLGANAYHYLVEYDKSGPSITVTGDFLTEVSNFKVWEKSITLDPVTGKATIRIVTTYNNVADGSGDDRIIDETFVQQ